MMMTAMIIITIITIIIITADGLILAGDIITTTDPHIITAGIGQHILIAGTDQHLTSAGIGQHTTTTAHLTMADGAAITAGMANIMADTAVGGLAGEFLCLLIAI